MSKKKLVAIILCIVVAVLINIFVFNFVGAGKVEDNSPMLKYNMSSDTADMYQLFYGMDDDFSEENMSFYKYEEVNKIVEAGYGIDMTKNSVRLDLGSVPSTITISDICIEIMFRTYKLDFSVLTDATISNGIASMKEEDGNLLIETSADDPYVILDLNMEDMYKEYQDRIDKDTLIIDIIICILIDIAFVIGMKYIGKLAVLPVELYKNKALIASLAKNDFKTRFAGSYLGIVWAFIQPIVTVIVYWFVFEVGLRAGRMCDYPYILWFMAGLVPWFYFSEALNGGTNSLIEYNYLVKKVVFKISILPMVKVISAIFVHGFFIIFVVILASCYGYTPDLYSIQILYYVLCSFVLVLGLSYFTSAIVVFFRDLSQVINIILQVGMWITPIMWDATNTLSAKWQVLFRINPVYYIVDGFRDAILGKVWFWDKMLWTVYFWLFVVAVFALGATVFKKLRVHFADVL